MIGIENGARACDVQHLVGTLCPRDRHDPVYEVPGNRELGRHRRHPAQFPQLAQRSFLDHLRQRFFSDLRFQLGEIVKVIFAQFFVNYAQLLL